MESSYEHIAEFTSKIRFYKHFVDLQISYSKAILEIHLPAHAQGHKIQVKRAFQDLLAVYEVDNNPRIIRRATDTYARFVQLCDEGRHHQEAVVGVLG